MPAPVVHFEINARDAEKARQFYSRLFDWKIEDFDGYGMVQPGERGIGGGISAADENTPAPVTIYVEVDDPDAYLRKAESLGGRTVVPTTEIPNAVTFAMFADPEGHVIGLVKSEDYEHPH